MSLATDGVSEAAHPYARAERLEQDITELCAHLNAATYRLLQLILELDREGQEVMRIGAFMKTFHFQSVYAYVLEQAYLEQPSFQRYIEARADHIREAGFDTDIWGYESFHD